MEPVSGKSSHPDTKSASVAPLWLGAMLGQERLAIQLIHVGAVFKSASSTAAKAALAPLDLETHGGMPVFMTSFLALFEPLTGRHAAPPSLAGEWVVTRRHPNNALVGCRVQSVHGPFYAFPEGNEAVSFEGKRWTVCAPKGLHHA